MLAVVKTPHTKITLEGEISKKIFKVIKSEFGEKLKIQNEDGEELIDPTQEDWFKRSKKRLTPGKNLNFFRENNGWSQEEIGQKLGGLSRFNISDIEHGRRAISKNIGKKLSIIFDTPLEFFL